MKIVTKNQMLESLLSVLDVNVNNHDDIKKSIEKVIKSFGKQNNNNDEFW